MPFSFKPETDNSTQGQSMPAAGPSLSGPMPSLMSRESETGTSLIHLLCLGAFDIMVVATVVLFGYHWYLGAQVDAKKAKLNSFDSQLGTLPINDMRVLSNRIKIVNQLLQTHPSVEAAFRIVEESAENKVVYSRFDLHSVDATHGYELLLSASAPDYHTVINQMDAFKQKTFSTYISTVEISNLHPDTNGQVGFNLKMPIMISGILPETIPLDPANIVNLQAQGILPASTPKETPAPTTSPNGAATTTQKASPTTVLNINDASKAPKK